MDMDLTEDLKIHMKPAGGRPPRHYHGGTVRRLFLLGGIIMLLALPFTFSKLSILIFTISLFAVLVVGVGAGFMSPTQKWVVVLDLFISAFAFVVFEFVAVDEYVAEHTLGFIFWVNQVLALIFFFALYYTSKTLRGRFFDRE